MSIDCSQCEPVLLDLCYGELTPQHELEVRTHILECPTCRKALSRLESGQALARHLPDETPSPELTEKILRAAQVHVRRNSGSWLERVQLVIESMARVAMTRQAAMVTLSLLIVFVGLWSYPELTRRREAHPSMVVEPTHDGEAGPSHEIAAASPQTPAAVPPEPIESAPVDRAAEGARPASPRKAAAELASKREERLARVRSSSGPVADRAKEKSADAKGRFAPPPPKAARKIEAPSEAEAAPQLAAAEPPIADDLLAMAPSGRNERNATSLGSVEAKQQAAPATSAAPTSAAAPAAPATLDDVYKAGVERYRAEDYPAAAQLFSRMLESSAPSAQRAAALLYLARSERALDRCDRAIRAYETLVRSYGSAQQSSSALTEGLACYDQLGDAKGAARLLEHASSVPSLSVQASRTAQERSAAKPAEPAQPASPPPARQ